MRILSKENCFRGIYTALVTPFTSEGAIDHDAWDALLKAQLRAGVHGVVPCGTTGESPTLSNGEKLVLIQSAVKACVPTKGKTAVVAGTGTNDTRETCEFTAQVSELGVDACLVVTPYYNKPSQAGLERHFKFVADASKVPIILYNVPGRTGVSLTPATVARLATHPNIAGIKEASGDLNLFMRMRAAVGQETKRAFYFLSGDDPTFWPFLAMGGDGMISVASNVVPGCMRMIFENWNEGRTGAGFALFEKLHPLLRNLFIEANPVPLKQILSYIGKATSIVRPPLAPLSPENAAKLKAVWDALLPHLKEDRPREELRV